MARLVKKIVGFAGSIKNFPLFLYRLCHRMRWDLPGGLVSLYRKKNVKKYAESGAEPEWLDTYEGSSQSCHPSMVCYKGVNYLVVTPYPYGMEEYENPSLFVEQEGSFIPLGKEPIDMPDKRMPGNHLSDPCLFVQDDTLFCFYRNTIKEKNGIRNVILYKSYGDGTWSERKEVLSSMTDGLLSPAVVCSDGVLWMYYVSFKNGELQLRKAELNDEYLPVSDTECKVNNIPDGFRVWHIEMKENASGGLLGLFLMRQKAGSVFKLYHAEMEKGAGVWTLVRECPIPKSVKERMRHPYKCCYFPDFGRIMLSFKDKKSVWCMKIIENK